MKLTNVLGLPDAIRRAVENDPYTRGEADISVTGLIAPARMTELMRRHDDELTEDVADRLFSLYGQIAHLILERAEMEGMVEERLFMRRHGWVISGKFDRLVVAQGLLQDYKLTSTYTVSDGPKPEWIAQASLYRLLLAENGVQVDRAENVVMFRDWSKGKARRNPAFPQMGAMAVPTPLWDIPTTEAYIEARLRLHSRAHIDLPDCTPEERWERGGSFAVMKPGGKRALAVHETMEEAIADIRFRADKTLQVQRRHPEQVRCADYCPSAPVCAQWAALNPDPLGLASGPVKRIVDQPQMENHNG